MWGEMNKEGQKVKIKKKSNLGKVVVMEKWYLGLLKKDTCFSEQFLAIRNNASKSIHVWVSV